MTKVIAVVDDDRNILTSVSMALENEGFKVQTYLDGESAFIGISRTPPDLAIIDKRRLSAVSLRPNSLKIRSLQSEIRRNSRPHKNTIRC